jgi:hypothetical protein
MPLPSEPITLRGGCSCKAVRWRMSLPEASERALNIYHSPGADIGDVRLPTAAICHCNGCRQAVCALGAYGFTTDMATMELSIFPKTTVPNTKNVHDETRPAYVSALSVLDEPQNTDISGLWLSHFESLPHRNRWFCGRCGTQLGMAPSKESLPASFRLPRIMSLWAATMDRDLLQNDWCRPEHIMNCSIAIPWVRDYVRNGEKNAQEHPFIFIDSLMTDDIRPHIEMLKQVGIDLNITMWD